MTPRGYWLAVSWDLLKQNDQAPVVVSRLA
jgi:hypothetical protein